MPFSGDKHSSRFERSRIWKDADIALNLCDAFYTEHRFPKHSHDYYVVGVIAEGSQTFTHRGIRHHTPTGGMILLNPDDDHTGEPTNSKGFLWRALYPTRDQIMEAAERLGSNRQSLPSFSSVRVDDPLLLRFFNQLHSAARAGANSITRETLFVELLSLLITRHSNLGTTTDARRRERWVVRKAKQLFKENLSQNLTLGEVARHLGSDPFRLVRAFNQELGLPPHVYLESYRNLHFFSMKSTWSW